MVHMTPLKELKLLSHLVETSVHLWQSQWAHFCWWGLFPAHQSVCLCRRSSPGCLSPCCCHTPTLRSTGLAPWPVLGWHSPNWAERAPVGTAGHIPPPRRYMCTGVYSWAGSSLHSGKSCCCTHRVCPLTWLQREKNTSRGMLFFPGLLQDFWSRYHMAAR